VFLRESEYEAWPTISSECRNTWFIYNTYAINTFSNINSFSLIIKLSLIYSTVQKFQAGVKQML